MATAAGITEEERQEAYRLAEDVSTHPGDIGILAPYRRYMLYECNTPTFGKGIDCSFAQLKESFAAWSVPGLMKGTRALIGRAGAEDFMISVYTEEEIAQDPEKADVKLFWFPAGYEDDGKGGKRLIGADKPFILSAAGGAYTSVCSLAESFPFAASANAAGRNVFCLNYRVSPSEISEVKESLMPKPLEDVAAALKCIYAHMDYFGLKTKEYIVNGYSAGASLTVQWGVQDHGYPYYGMPKPKALFPIYPVIESSVMVPDSADEFLTIMFGPGYTRETVEAYDIPKVITDDYPPCYIVHCVDDDLVPVENSYKLERLLKERNIPVFFEAVPQGGHGFGDGSGMAAEGWPARAFAFTDNL